MLDYPPVPPVVIFIGGQMLNGWTAMTLSRSKKEMTGQLSVSIFFTFVPKGPVLTQAAAGKEVTVYIGGHLAFTGSLDKREGTKKPSRSQKVGAHYGKGVSKAIGSGKQTKAPEGITSHIGPDQYTVTLSARGKTKKMMTSSHQHKTGQINNAKTRPVVEQLVKPFGVQLDWRGPSLDMDKIRFRDGGIVHHEIDRVCNEYCYARYETREGKLRVTDKAGPERGEPLILGENILGFEATQSEEGQNNPITVKGQRTKKNIRGRDAVNRSKTVKNKLGPDNTPIVIQHNTDASDEALERRGRHEANTRNAESKKITIDVFHVMERTGQPWDIGTLHYVEVPVEGVFGDFECTSVQYTVNFDKTIKTVLELSPPPAQETGASSGALATAVAKSEYDKLGEQRMAAQGIQPKPGEYPSPWLGPQLSDITASQADVDAVIGGNPSIEGLTAEANKPPPLVLPPHIFGPGRAL